MKIHLHKNAKTTPAQRALIQAGGGDLNTAELAQKLGVSQTTVRKWKKRTSVYDRPHIPHRVHSVLSPVQETIVVALRVCLRPGLDDLLTLVRRFIYPAYARSSLNRCLNRYGISRLKPLKVSFPSGIKDYRGTFLYHSVICLPDFHETPDMGFLHIFLDCTTRQVHAGFAATARPPDLRLSITQRAVCFPIHILGTIKGVLIDLSGRAADRNFKENNRHTTLSFNVPISSGSLNEFQNRLPHLLAEYNTVICQRTLKQKTPVQVLRHRYTIFPGSFRLRPE